LTISILINCKISKRSPATTSALGITLQKYQNIMCQSTNLPLWLHWLETCPSTNTWARDRLDSLSHGDAIYTRNQTAGRGQHGRIWYSDPGVLTASFVVEHPTAQLSGFSLAAGLATIYAIAELLPNFPEILRLKWPNDVLIDRRKLAGILCESRVHGSTSKVVVGIGLNRCANFDQTGLEDSAISLDQISAIVPDELVILERLRHHLLEISKCCRDEGIAAILPDIGDRDALRYKSVTLDLGSETVTGEAIGISDRGCLLLRLPDGELRAFTNGRVRVFN
jgi:BirA family transcriptional regulator, biotin operon repressor / biotin---[acetyl-CoA-carboxylase] ligase